MTELLRFRAYGDPKPQGRPRAWFNAKVGRASVYDGKTSDGWKGIVALAAREHLPAAPHEGPLEVEMHFVFRRPAGHFGSGKNAAVLKKASPLHHVKGTDLDNLAKAILDCLTQVGAWKDDGQIVKLVVTKAWETAPIGPGCDVTVRGVSSAI